MGIFAKTLVQIRKENSPLSAKSAWQKWTQRGLSVNYPYYMKLEKGDTLPSPEVIEQLARHLTAEQKERLIYSYCQEVFPSNKGLFQINSIPDLSPLRPPPSDSNYQYHLSLRQVHFLASHKSYYQIFIALVLARKEIHTETLSEFITTPHLKKKIAELSEHKLIYIENDLIRAVSTEIRFPEVTQTDLRDIYKKFDAWDSEFAGDFNFKSLYSKKILRRVSPRYIEILAKQLELTTDLIKSSDELDNRFNNEVIQLEINLLSGKIPG